MDRYGMQQEASLQQGFEALRNRALHSFSFFANDSDDVTTRDSTDQVGGRGEEELFVLAWMYDHGVGIPVDHKKAARMYEVAAFNGSTGMSLILFRYARVAGVSACYVVLSLWLLLL